MTTLGVTVSKNRNASLSRGRTGEIVGERSRAKLRGMGVNPYGTINAADAGICWEIGKSPRFVDLGKPITDLKVIDLHRLTAFWKLSGDQQADLADRHEIFSDDTVWNNAAMTNGSCCGDWMENPRATPEGLFAGLLFNGDIPTGKGLGPIFREFAKIKECGWARAMLAGLNCPDVWNADDPEGYNL